MGKNEGEHAKVLSYGDVVLRSADVRLLEGPFFLNDPVIEFFFAYLSPSPSPQSDLLLLGPALTFWILHAPDHESRALSVDPLHLRRRQFVLFPINNNEEVEEAGGGSHWSLLSYDRKRNVFEHYDSISEMNRRHASSFVSKIKPFMGSAAASAMLEEPPTPQQENGYDCGVYVMKIAEILCNEYQENSTINEEALASSLKSLVTPASVHNMRQRIHNLISSLAKS